MNHEITIRCDPRPVECSWIACSPFAIPTGSESGFERIACHRNIHTRFTAVQPGVKNVETDIITEGSAKYRESAILLG
jgi:hypothetical protein